MSLSEVDGNDAYDEPVKEAPQVTVNLDAEYFKWKKEKSLKDSRKEGKDAEDFSVEDLNQEEIEIERKAQGE